MPTAMSQLLNPAYVSMVTMQKFYMIKTNELLIMLTIDYTKDMVVVILLSLLPMGEIKSNSQKVAILLAHQHLIYGISGVR